jgi:hypothetical protein
VKDVATFVSNSEQKQPTMEGDTGQQKSVKETPIEHTNKLMKTSHDDILGIARNEPLNKEMLHLIGMNLEGLQIIVKRFENELIATKDELLEMLAKERLERAILIGRMGKLMLPLFNASRYLAGDGFTFA